MNKKYLMYLGKLFVIALIYFIAARFGLAYCSTQAEVTLIWPPTGISIAILLLMGWRFWPGIFLGAMIANYSIGQPVSLAAVIATGNTLEALTAYFLLHRYSGFRCSLNRLDDVVAFVIYGVLLSPLVSAIIGVSAIGLSGRMPWVNFFSVIQNWYIGDAGGAILIAPFLLSFFSGPLDSLVIVVKTMKFKLACVVAALIFITYLVFYAHVEAAYLYSLLVVYAAVNFYTRITSLLVIVIAATVLFFSLSGIGPLVAPDVHATVVNLILFLSTISITGLLASVTITGRTQAETAITAGEAKLNLLLSSTEEPIYGTNSDGVCTFCNRACVKVLGYGGQDDLLGKDIHHLIHHTHENGKIYDPSDCKFHQINTDMIGCHLEDELFFRANGSSFPVEVWAHPQIEDGITLGSVVVFHDITERKQAELALLQSEEKFRMVFESISDAVLLSTQSDGTILECNESLFGYTKEDMIGRSSLDLFWLDTSDRQRLLDEFVNYRGAFDFETRLKRKDGSVFNAIITASFIEIRGQSCILSVIRDYTARKQAEVALFELNEHLDQRVTDRTRELETTISELESFSYSISHDLRTPLRSIDGLSKIVIEDNFDILDDQSKAYLNMVRLNAEHMARVIDDLLRLSRINRFPFNIQEIDLSELVSVEAKRLHRSDPERKVAWKITSGLIARADADLIGIMFENILDNAWKFTAKVSFPVIEFGRILQNNATVFYLRDNGIGFDMRYAHKLFKPFERLQSDSDFSGSGVGLAIVERIVLRHGGEVWAEGRPGEGTVIYFTLGC